jgi:hypothetical protein
VAQAHSSRKFRFQTRLGITRARSGTIVCQIISKTTLIPTLITKEPGHKEILASDTALDATSPTGTKVVALPFDVTLR